MRPQETEFAEFDSSIDLLILVMLLRSLRCVTSTGAWLNVRICAMVRPKTELKVSLDR